MLTLKLDLIPLPLNLVNICKVQGEKKSIQISKWGKCKIFGNNVFGFLEAPNSLSVNLSERTFRDQVIRAGVLRGRACIVAGWGAEGAVLSFH